jgi:SAM-dependent methyltransferase
MRNDHTPQFESAAAFVEDRTEQLGEYRRLFNPFVSFRDKIVAELGCSRGYLLDSFRRLEPFTAIGIDADSRALREGAAVYPDIRFAQSNATEIPLITSSVDVIYTIDTVEHLSRPVEIFRECHRVLRPGGIFLVHFHPWLGPYGAHLEDIIPFPWPHVIFSMRTLLAVAAQRYDDPTYKRAFWHQTDTGPSPNPYSDASTWDEYLNRMTVRRFRKLLRLLPFKVLHFKTIGFGGRRFRTGRLLGPLSAIRGFEEFFSKAVFCVLVK